MGIRPDLEGAAAVASTRKGILGMDDAERHRLMDVLLEISRISMQAFDVLEADAISEADVFVFLRLPDCCNEFTRGIEHHARTKLARRAGLSHDT